MAVEVLLPKLGLTMEEGTVDEWLVADGDVIAVGDPLLRLATDKVDVDVEAEAGGRFHRAVPAGATLPPGALLGWLLADGEEPPEVVAVGPAAPQQAAAAVAAPASPSAAPAPPAARGDGGRLLSSPLARRLAGELSVDIESVSGTGPGGRILAAAVQEASAAAPRGAGVVSSPLVRRDAAELGIDLAAVRGTGPGGRITRDDVRTLGRLVRPTDQVTVIPLKGMRGAIATRMVASLHEMAQLTHGFEVSMDEVVAVRDQLKRDWPELGLPVPSLNDFVVRAAALALREHPGLNATVVDNEIRLLPDIHVGMAVAVPGGLVVPVIRDADRLSLQQLAGETRSLATRARDGKLALADLEGATFAVTSLGTYGVDFFTPVINPGNVAILGVGRLRDGVRWTDDDRPLRTRVLTLSLTFDHRAVDGAPAAEYLQTLAELLTRPMVLVPEA
jgi:pyruvate/2-oxoglutarate dehydrogenase complex dihydrolipoamide acyltransferase (E2) component